MMERESAVLAEIIENGCSVHFLDVPEKSFREDPLRILRGLRLLSERRLCADPLTAAALHGCAHLVKNIPAERFFEELCGILMGEDVTRVLLDYPDVFSVWIPEIYPCIGFSQHSRYHDFTVWEHIARSVGAAPPILPVRLCMLLHDIAKPACYRVDGRGGHFTGHGEKSAVAADGILRRIRCPGELRERITRLILHHRAVPDTGETVNRLRMELGREDFSLYAEVIKADDLSKREGTDKLSPRVKNFLHLAQLC